MHWTTFDEQHPLLTHCFATGKRRNMYLMPLSWEPAGPIRTMFIRAIEQDRAGHAKERDHWLRKIAEYTGDNELLARDEGGKS